MPPDWRSHGFDDDCFSHLILLVGVPFVAVSHFALRTLDVLPAVDFDHFARDVSGEIRAEEGDDMRHFFRRAQPAQHDLGQRLVFYILRRLLNHVGLDQPRRNGVDVDVKPPSSRATALVKPMIPALAAE